MVVLTTEFEFFAGSLFVFDLEEAGVKTGENVGDTVVHDQHVDPCPLLPQDDQPCPGVHHQGENSNRYVGKKVAVFLVHIHLSSITYQQTWNLSGPSGPAVL